MARSKLVSPEAAERQRRIEFLQAAFRWPDESVCGYEWCPQKNGYCLECHTLAYNEMLRARQWMIDTMIQLGRTP